MKLSRFRFYCGLIDPQGNTVDESEYIAEVLACEYIQGFTVFHGTGYWEGTKEGSLIIEIICEDGAVDAGKLARYLRAAGSQDAVLWTAESIEAHLVCR